MGGTVSDQPRFPDGNEARTNNWSDPGAIADPYHGPVLGDCEPKNRTSVWAKLDPRSWTWRRQGADWYAGKEEETRNYNNNVLPTGKKYTLHRRHTEKDTPLTSLLHYGSVDVDGIRRLLRRPDTDVNRPKLVHESAYRTVAVPPLFLAIQARCQEAVQLLLDAGASPAHTDSLGRSALYHAAIRGDPNTCRLLLSLVPSLYSPDDSYDPLHEACRHGHTEVVQMLIDAGVDVNPAKPDNGAVKYFSPLQLAIEHEHEDVCLALLENGADMYSTGNKKESPFIEACRHGVLQVVRHMLDRGAPIDQLSSELLPPLVYAIRSGELSCIQRTIQYSAIINRNGIAQRYFETLQSSAEIINSLCSYGCDLESSTPTALCRCLQTDNISAAIVLLKHGARFHETPANCVCSQTVFNKSCPSACEAVYRLLEDRPRELKTFIMKFPVDGLDIRHGENSLSFSGLSSGDGVSQAAYRTVGVPSLKQDCRQIIRRSVKEVRSSSTTSIISRIHALPLPKLLISYLCFDEFRVLDYIDELVQFERRRSDSFSRSAQFDTY